MNRRTLLKSGIFVGLSAVLPAAITIAKNKSRNSYLINNCHKFNIGKLELTVITDGHIRFKEIQPHFAPDAAESEVAQLLKDNFLPQQADLGINVLVVKLGNNVILVDTGCGGTMGSSSGWLLQNLTSAGFKSEDITDIVLTHAHPDHIGGLLDVRGNLAFKNANVYLSKQEYDFWLSDSPDFSKSKLQDEALKNMIVSVARERIKKANTKMHLFTDGDTVLNCIKFNLAPGHTPGHTVITIFSDGQELVHTGDLVHNQVLLFAHPEWGFEGDTDFKLAVYTRKKVLEDLAENGKQVFSYHLPWPGLGHVRKKDSGFEWVQQSFSLPD